MPNSRRASNAAARSGIVTHTVEVRLSRRSHPESDRGRRRRARDQPLEALERYHAAGGCPRRCGPRYHVGHGRSAFGLCRRNEGGSGGRCGRRCGGCDGGCSAGRGHRRSRCSRRGSQCGCGAGRCAREEVRFRRTGRSGMLLLVGLGNPGARYVGNRHNVGFMTLQAIAQRHGIGPWRRRFQGVACGRADRWRALSPALARDLHE